MGLLNREGMRDVDIGICWDAGYIGICGIGGDMGDMRRYVGYVEICGIGGEDGGVCGDMWDMRDRWGICGDMRRYVGYAEICGICGTGGEDGGYVGRMGDRWRYAGRTTSPKSARPGCRFLDQPPPQSTKTWR